MYDIERLHVFHRYRIFRYFVRGDFLKSNDKLLCYKMHSIATHLSIYIV